MTFLHKLAQRLARLKAGLALGLLAILACERPTGITDGSGVPASLTISPKTLTLLPNQTAQFMVVGLTAAGDTGAVAVSWSVTGGIIVDTGSSGRKHFVYYKSPTQPGSYNVVAKGNGTTLTDSAAVTVIPLPVASVTVSPASPYIIPGQSVQLTATTYDSTGAALTGRVVTWATSNVGVATVNDSGLVTGVAAGAATITATSEGKSGRAVARVATAVTNPGTVSDLAVAGVTDTSVTLSFTEVSDGAGQPASYDVRYAAGTITWASAASVTQGSCSTPVPGIAFGAKRTCTVLGLAPATGYEFQLVAFRGTLNVDAVFGGYSNVVSGTTTVH
jgi:Big-like domain-containing protein/fibronectin type III domain protein